LAKSQSVSDFSQLRGIPPGFAAGIMDMPRAFFPLPATTARENAYGSPVRKKTEWGNEYYTVYIESINVA
jgi:hypothetical protein